MLPTTCAIEYLRFAERHYRHTLNVARARPRSGRKIATDKESLKRLRRHFPRIAR